MQPLKHFPRFEEQETEAKRSLKVEAESVVVLPNAVILIY